MQRGFSLIEMAMVLLIVSIFVSYGLKMSQATGTRDCNIATKAQLQTIKAAFDRFTLKNDRLPYPALRNVGVESTSYGAEAVIGSFVAADYSTGATSGTVVYGALPFKTLGLPQSFGGDCWGNKFTYAMSKAMATNASSGGYLDATVSGAITAQNGSGGTLPGTYAYAVISHGADGVGGVATNATSASWCSAPGNLQNNNCYPTAGIVVASEINDGKNASTSIKFDDLVLLGSQKSYSCGPSGTLQWATGSTSFGSGNCSASITAAMTTNGTNVPLSFSNASYTGLVTATCVNGSFVPKTPNDATCTAVVSGTTGACNNATPLGCSVGSAINDNGATSCGATRTWNCHGTSADSAQCSYTNTCTATGCPRGSLNGEWPCEDTAFGTTARSYLNCILYRCDTDPTFGYTWTDTGNYVSSCMHLICP